MLDLKEFYWISRTDRVYLVVHAGVTKQANGPMADFIIDID